ncbi:hypothetical protein Tco_0488305 [Tanacetum coccineum]
MVRQYEEFVVVVGAWLSLLWEAGGALIPNVVFLKLKGSLHPKEDEAKQSKTAAATNFRTGLLLDLGRSFLTLRGDREVSDGHLFNEPLLWTLPRRSMVARGERFRDPQVEVPIGREGDGSREVSARIRRIFFTGYGVLSLLYLTASRPDIMFSVCLCARFQEDPKTSHLEAVKRIFRYIKGTTPLGLWYPKGSGIETIVYADSDHAGDYIDRKSNSGVCTFMGCCLTSWFSKKQTALAISTTEAEYVSAGMACQQALWMKQVLVDYGVRLDDIPITCDNKGGYKLK